MRYGSRWLKSVDTKVPSGIILKWWKKAPKGKYCLTVLSFSKITTSNLKRHLFTKHPTVPYLNQPPRNSPNDASNASASNETPASGSCLDNKGEVSIPSSTNSIYNYLHKPVSQDTKRQLDRMLLDFITKECLPFSIVESKEFQKFLHTLNPNYTLPSRKTISNALLPSVYNEEMEKVKKNVGSTKTIALTSDGLSNMNNISFHALTAHYIDESLKLHSKFLKCSEFKGSHTGSQIASWITEV